VWRLDQWKNPPKEEEETHRHNTKKKKRAKCDEVCVCTAVIFPGEMVGYNNMFQNPVERRRRQQKRSISTAAAASQRLCILFSVLTLFIFFRSYFQRLLQRRTHTHKRSWHTHTNFIFSFFLSYLCLSSSLFIIDYIVYTRRDIIYTSSLVLPLLLPLLLVFRGSSTVSMTRMFKETFSLFSKRKKSIFMCRPISEAVSK
jgi:hypothetical protein